MTTTKKLKFDTSNIVKQGKSMIPFLGSLSYATTETNDDKLKPQGAYFKSQKIPDIRFNRDDHHLVVSVGTDAIKYISKHQIKEIEVILKDN